MRPLSLNTACLLLLAFAMTPVSASDNRDETLCDHHYRSERLEEATPYCRRATESGSALSMTNLSSIERRTQGAPRVDLLLKAAHLGNARAQYNLGHQYLAGNFLEKDNGEAERWLQAAADNGWPHAHLELAALKEQRGNTDANKDEVEEHYLAALEADTGYVAYRLAFLNVERGDGPALNYWLTVAAQNGEWRTFENPFLRFFGENYRLFGPAPVVKQLNNPDISTKINHLIRDNDDSRGFLLPSDLAAKKLIDRVRKILPAKVRRHLYEAQWTGPELIHVPLLESLTTVPYDGLLDGKSKLMLSLWQSQLEELDTEEQSNDLRSFLFSEIAVSLLENGLHGEALDWFNQRSEYGDISEGTLFEFGKAWETGVFGHPDEEKAVELYKQAVGKIPGRQFGDGRAAFEMAMRYGKGRGVKKDIEKALEMLTLFTDHECDAVLYEENEQITSRCTNRDGINFEESFLLSSGLLGEELKQFGRQRIVELAQSGEASTAKHRERAEEYASLILGTYDSNNFLDHRAGGYLRESYVPERAEGAFSKRAWRDWQKDLNRASRRLFPDAKIDLIKHLSIIPGNEITEDFGALRSVVPIVVILVHNSGYEDRETNTEIEKQLRRNLRDLADANQLLESCDISIRLAGVAYVDAYVGPEWEFLDSAWMVEPEGAGKTAELDWRLFMPSTKYVTMVFLNGDPKALGGPPGIHAPISSESGHTFFGSNNPLLIAESSEFTLAHEIGHALGLAHPSHFDPSLMAYDWDVFEDERLPISFSSDECKIMSSSPFLE